MADPTTLLAYATQRRDDVKDNAAAAQQRLAEAQSNVSSSTAELEGATTALAELEKAAADIRQKLSLIKTPADGAALLDALEEKIIRARSTQVAVEVAQAKLSAARADQERAQTDLAASSAQLTRLEAALTEVTEATKRRAGWITALGVPPLAKINTDADKALTTKPFTDAKARVAKDIPPKLLTRVEQRRAAQFARLSRADVATGLAADAVVNERDKNGGLTGHAGALTVTFQRAEGSAGTFVNLAKERFDQAQEILTSVVDPSRAPLTAEQVGRINDTTLKAGREAAAAEEEAVDVKFKALVDAQAALEDAILAARAANKDPETEKPVSDAKKEVTKAAGEFKTVDDAWRLKERALTTAFGKVDEKRTALSQAIQKAIAAHQDPTKDPGVIKAQGELAQAQTDLQGAQSDYRKSNHGILHAWEAAVPDSCWQLVEDYENAADTLKALKDSDPVKLGADLKDAEGKVVAGLLAADVSGRVVDQLSAIQAQRAAQQESARQARSTRLLSALRGDN